MDPSSSFEEEVQEHLEDEILKVVTGSYRKEEHRAEESRELPYKTEPEKTMMSALLEKTERERQVSIMLNVRPKPQNAERQQTFSVNVRPMRPRRAAAFDLGTPVQVSEVWHSSRRLQFYEGTSSGLDNELTETPETCANENQPLKESSMSSLEGSLEEIILDGKKINYQLAIFQTLDQRLIQ